MRPCMPLLRYAALVMQPGTSRTASALRLRASADWLADGGGWVGVQVAGIDVTEQTPVGHGAVICVSVYAGEEDPITGGQVRTGPAHTHLPRGGPHRTVPCRAVVAGMQPCMRLTHHVGGLRACMQLSDRCLHAAERCAQRPAVRTAGRAASI